MNKHQLRADRQAEIKSEKVREERGYIIDGIQEATRRAQREEITWEERAAIIASLLEDKPEEWMPKPSTEDGYKYVKTVYPFPDGEPT